MTWLFTHAGDASFAAVFFLLGAFVGGAANLWSLVLTPGGTSRPGSAARDAADTQLGSFASAWPYLVPLVGYLLARGRPRRFRNQTLGASDFAVEAVSGLLFAAYAVAATRCGVQRIDEVQPDDVWRWGRVIYHLALVSFLIAATLTDLRDYVIPDEITLPGALVGVLGAFASGQLQMVHLWVDWSHEVQGLQGPYIPAWLDAHRHLHGLAWSLAGAAVGAGLTWFVRAVSSWILGREALGFGDVTLMAMIGSYLGWQPTVFVFLLAPVCGLACTIPLRVMTGRDYVPYGPFLASAAVVVLFTWRWLWLPTRLIFGHPLSLLMLAGIGAGGLIVLLIAMRRLGLPRGAGPEEARAKHE
jgi:leader peptidase (prepilin peptidase)/N-methyltransferase